MAFLRAAGAKPRRPYTRHPIRHLRKVSSGFVGSPSAAREAPAVAPQVCPYYHAAVELIGKRWTGAILCALAERPLRFGELKHSVPRMSDRLLSERLRELEAEGLVRRQVDKGAGVRVNYSLSDKGDGLRPVISELSSWARQWNGRRVTPV
jgi:DNA-binding HxlR family transcriptional regulator